MQGSWVRLLDPAQLLTLERKVGSSLTLFYIRAFAQPIPSTGSALPQVFTQRTGRNV